MAGAKPLAIVTGATRGLGHAIATALVGNGFEVAGIGRSEIKDAPFELLQCDFSQPSGVEALFQSSLAHRIKGRTRVVLVNNAGTLGPVGSTASEASDAARLDEAIRINLTCPMLLTSAVIREADASAAVRIINISSGAAGRPISGWSTYCASKAALRMAGRVVAADLEAYPELQGRDIRILDYSPGVVDTEMQRQVREIDAKDFPGVATFTGYHEDGKLVKPEDSAKPVLEFAQSGQGEGGEKGDMFVQSDYMQLQSQL